MEYSGFGPRGAAKKLSALVHHFSGPVTPMGTEDRFIWVFVGKLQLAGGREARALGTAEVFAEIDDKHFRLLRL